MQGLVLLALTSGGSLPWVVAKSDAELQQMKERCDIAKLCAQQGCPELAQLIAMCRGANRSVRPSYDAIKQLLTTMLNRKVCMGMVQLG